MSGVEAEETFSVIKFGRSGPPVWDANLGKEFGLFSKSSEVGRRYRIRIGGSNFVSFQNWPKWAAGMGSEFGVSSEFTLRILRKVGEVRPNSTAGMGSELAVATLSI